MFCPHKNSYLQLVCAMNPRMINKAVDKAMERSEFDPHCETPAAQRMTSMQPSLYAPHVDITRAKLGFGRIGLKLLIRELHSEDYLVQLQAIHSVLDQVQISENALFLLKLHVVYRLIDLMDHKDPVIREKICLILTLLATYYQGRKQIMSRPVIIDNLLYIIVRDRKEIRYVAAATLRTLSRDRCSCELIMKNEKVIEDLLKVVKNEHSSIVLLHLQTLANLAAWDPTRQLKANAFQIMLSLFTDRDPKIVSAAMDCMTQLCKDDIGKILADEYDITFYLRPYLMSKNIEVIISAVNLMAYTTLTTRSKWRAKECMRLPRRLVELCHTPNKPVLQLGAMQVLMNLCDIPDIRYNLRLNLDKNVKSIKIRYHEDWDGTTETSSFGLETGHNYRTMSIEKVETIKNDYGDNALVINVHSYLRRLHELKARLIYAIHKKPYRH
ncbi:uncharacterized protein LOC128669927 [Plodia interpunctella]|uniref:uncharacterized protein LOC128669927 n=1 Tax=Plodia interpunctella TaxID=58824 RepID=UPI002367B267|nr:uncharacterized protein LOC128669927 [Plodia interpunctella]